MFEKFDIETYNRVGKIHFGASRREIRRLFPDFTEFKKNDDDYNTTDAYENFHIYYAQDASCEAVEFFGNASIFFQNTELLGKTYKNVKEYFYKFDNDLDFDECGFTSLKCGLGIYVADASMDNSLVEGVIVFKRDYYN